MKRTALKRWIPANLSALATSLGAAWPRRSWAFLAVALSLGSAAPAASLIWDANDVTLPNPDGGTGIWDVNTTTNWWDGAANVVWPAPGGTDDDAVFSNNAGTVSIAAGGVTANDITFNTAGYLIQNNTLTLNGTTPTITTGAGISATISSVLSGTSGLTKAGSGTLILTGANNYSGGTASSAVTQITGGTLQLGSGAVNGTVAGSYNIGAGTTMFLNNATAVQALTGGWASQITGSGTLRLNSAQAVNGTANWGPNAAGAFPFNAGFTGTVQVDNGRLDSSPAGFGGVSNVVINTNGQFLAWNGTYNQAFSIAGDGWGEAGQPGALRVAGGNNATFNGNITLTANAGISSQDGNSVMTINGAISGGFNLTKQNGGLLTLTGANTYSGTTTVNSGILNFANTQSFYNGNTGMWNDTNLIVNSGAIAAFRVGGAGEFTLADIDAFRILSTATGGFKSGSGIGIDTTSAGGTLTYSSVIANNGANTLGFAKLGAGTLVLDGANTYTGNTYIGAGGTLEIAGAAGTLGGGTYNGVISGGGNFVKSSSGTLTLGTANTYTGKTTLTGGTLVIGADNRLGAAPGAATADQLTINGATLRMSAGAQTLAANRGITIGSLGATLDSEALSDASGNSTTIAGPISGTGPLTIKANGDQSASGAGSNTIGFNLTNITNSFTGDVTITNGLVAYANNSAFGNSANRIILNGGGLLDNNANIALAREIEVQAGGGTFRTYGTTTTFWSGPVTGSGNINRTDGGTLVLTGNLSGYSGTFNNQAGATVLSGTNPVIGGNWNIAASTVGVASTANQTLVGTVSGAGGFTKSNTGTLTLSGDNTYTGVTSINNGTLAITGSPTGVSAISQNGGTLRLDYDSNNTSKIGDTAVLTLNGGTVTLAGGALGTHTELVGGTNLNGGATLNRSGTNTAVLALGAIIRGPGGALEVAGPGLATTTTGNTNGVLPGVTLAGGLAMNDGANNIVAYTGAYTDVNRLGGTISDGAASHARIIEAGSGSGITLAAAGTTTIATLSNNSTGGLAAIDVAAGNTLRLGAAGSILLPATSGGLTISGAGTLTAGGADNTAGGLLVQNESGTPATLSTLIANNGTGAVTLTKTGSGALSVTGVNTFTGGVNVNGGTLTARVNVGQNALGTGAVAVSGGSTLVLNNVSTVTGPVNISNVFSGAGNIQLLFADGTTSPRNTFLNGANALTAFAGNIRLSLAPGATATGDKYTSGAVSTAASVLIDPGTQLFVNAAASYFGGITVSGTGNSESRGAIRLANTLGGPISLAGDTSIGTEGGTISGAITSGAAGTQTLTFGTPSSTGNGTVNGVIGGGTGSIALVKNMGGIVTLRAPNTYSGGTTVNAGTLSIGTGGTGAPTAHPTSLGTGNVTVNTGGTLRLWIKNDSAFTIGNSLTLNGGAVRNEDGNHTLSGTVFADTAGATFTSQFDGKNLTLSNVVSGPGNVTVTTANSAASRVVLTAANIYTGATLVNSGTLSLSGTSGSILGTSGVSLATNATLRIDNTPTANAGDRLHDSKPVTVSGGIFNFAHTGGAASYAETAGPLTLGAGSSVITASQAASGQTSALTFASLSRNAGGIVDFTGTGLGADTRNRILFTANPGADGIIGPWATVNGNLAAYDSALGVREFTGYTELVRLTGSKVINDAPGSHIRIVEGTGALSNLTLSSAVTNASTISQTTIGGASAATIDTNGQTLRLGINGGVRSQAGAGAITIGLAANPGVLTAGGTDNTAGRITFINPSANPVTVNSAIVNNGTGTVSIESLSGALTIGGGTSNTFSGTLDISTLGSANTRSVTFAKTGGATAIGDNAIVNFGLGTTGEANLRMSASGQFGNNVVMNFANPNGAWARFDLMGTNQSLAGINTPTLAASQHGAVIQNRELSGSANRGTSTLTLTGSGTYQYNGYFRDADSGVNATNQLALTKSGSGTQTLAGNQIIYTGATTLSNGALVLQDTTAFGSPVTVSGTGVLNSVRTSLGIAGRSPILGPNVSGSGVLNINNGGSGLAGGWTTVGVANGLTMSGTININSGTLSRDNTTVSNINTTATVNVAAGAAFGAGRGGNSTIGALNGAGDVGTFWAGTNAGSITFGNGDGSGSFSGVIHGNGSSAVDGNIEGGVTSVTKIGTGTQVLSGINTYTGPTLVSAGELRVNGSIAASSSVTVSAGAKLSGSGIVSTVAFAGGSILSPGNSPGILNTGSATSSADVLIEIGGSAAGNGTGFHDQINTTGTLTLNGGLLTVGLIDGYLPSPGNTFDIWLNDGGDSILGTGTFTGLPEGAQIPIPETAGGSLDNDFWTITYAGNTGNDIRLTYVPEPGTLSLALIAGALALNRRRRSR